MNESQYRDRVAYQRSLGQAQVGSLLDGLCLRWGMDPVQTWRIPRDLELQEAARRREMLMWLYLHTMPVITPEEAFRLIGSPA